MAINFPNTPTVGDIHIENGNRFRWDGSGWIAIQEDATAIGDTPPSNPSPGDIWFDSANALLFIWYDDGNSQQWVNVTAGSVNPLWQTNSGDIYFDTGNVGIGTNTPASELDVNGDITVSGTVDGRDIANDGTKLDGIESGAQVNTVDKVGTPVDNQIGVWTGDGTIEGDSNFTWDGSTLSTIDNITMSGNNSSISDINIIQGATSTNLVVEVLSGGIFRVDKFGLFFNENMIVANPDGSVELYHDNSLKLETTANGIEVTGDIVVSGTGAVQLPVGTTAQQPSGSNGMVRYNSDETAVEAYYANRWHQIATNDLVQPDYGIINGAFDVWQRGVGPAVISSTNEFGPDRWWQFAIGGTVTQSRQSFSPGDKLGMNNPRYFFRLETTGQSAANNASIFRQRIEDVRSYAGQTITVLGWARRSAGSGNMAVEFVQEFGSGGIPSAIETGIGTTTVSLSSSWEPFAVTIDIPSISGKTLGTNDNSNLSLHMWTSAGSDYNARTNSLGIQTITVDIWGIHILLGEHTVDATNYYKSPNASDELIRCRRYFETGRVLLQSPVVGFISQSLQFSVRKRVQPSVTTTTNSSTGFTNFAVNTTTVDTVTFNGQATSGGGFINASWTASAEF